MNVEILKPYGKWKPGARPDLTRDFARELIAQGIAKYMDGSVEVVPSEKKEEEPKMVVNNYFLVPEDPEPEPDLKTKNKK